MDDFDAVDVPQHLCYICGAIVYSVSVNCLCCIKGLQCFVARASFVMLCLCCLLQEPLPPMLLLLLTSVVFGTQHQCDNHSGHKF